MRPTITVRANLVATRHDALGDLRCALERHRRSRERGRYAVSGEHTENPWRTFMDAVSVVALVAEIAHGLFEGDAELVHRLRSAIPILNVELGTFLDVDDDRQREARATRPRITHQ